MPQVTVKRFAKEDLIIDYVKALEPGDTVRDFFARDPGWGEVVDIEADGTVVVHWEGDEEPRRLGRLGGGKLIRARREDEVFPSEPPC